MRNLEAEQRMVLRLFRIGGAVFLLGLIALAVGTEMLVLSFLPNDPIKFWIWQGVWAICQAFVIANIGYILKKGQSATSGVAVD